MSPAHFCTATTHPLSRPRFPGEFERARQGTRSGRAELSNLCGPRCGSRLRTAGAALDVQQALPRLHPHTSVLAPVSLKGLKPYLTGVSRKPPREQGRVKAEVGRKSAPVAQRCPNRTGCGSPGGAALGRRALRSPLPQWRPMENRALGTFSLSLSGSHLRVLQLPGAGRGRAPGPGAMGKAAARSCPPQASSKPYL